MPWRDIARSKLSDANGPLHLKSNVRLHLSAEAGLEFSGSPEHYLPVVLTRWYRGIRPFSTDQFVFPRSHAA